MSYEDKKWTIERIDKVIDLGKIKLDELSVEFHKFAESETSIMDKLGKSILSVMSFLVTLILGLTAAKVIVDITLVEPILGMGITTYLITLLFKARYQSVFLAIENEMQKGKTPFYSFLGYFQDKTLNVDMSINYKDMADFFAGVVIPSLNLRGYYALVNTTNSIKKSFFLSIPAMKYLKQLRLSYKKFLDVASETYLKKQPTYATNELLEPLLVFGNALLDYRDGKQTIPQMTRGMMDTNQLKN